MSSGETTEGYGLAFSGKAAAVGLTRTAATGRLVAEAEHPGEDSTPPQHVFIAADNLEALKLLRPAHGGGVDCIYIDPPYNTGKDFVYRDRWAEDTQTYLQRSGQVDAQGNVLVANPTTSGRYHSAWLSMMLPRLILARQLLADDGVMFISIDDHEVANLRLLADEVFGSDCFIAQIVVVSNRGGRDYLRIATTHEYILCYGRSPQAPIAELPRPPAPGARTDDRGMYELRELRNRNPKFTPSNRPNLAYPIWVDPTAIDPADGTCAVSVEPVEGGVEVIPLASSGAGSVWRWGKPKLAAALVDGDPVASEVVARKVRTGGYRIFEKSRKSTTKARSVWDDPLMRSERGTRAVRELMGATVFDHPKSVDLVARCLQLGMPSDGLALDFFAGAGTMAHAAHTLNAADGGTRRTISINLAEPVPPDSAAAHAGHDTVAAVGRARVQAAVGPEALRCFSVQAPPEQAAEHDDPWDIAVAAGASVFATPTVIDPSTWRFDRGDAGPHLIALAPELSRPTVAAWALPDGARVSCRGTAPNDALTLFMARRFDLRRV